MLTRRQVLDSVVSFEQTHPVETYRFYDWNVWPLLRVVTSYLAAVQNAGKDGKSTDPMPKGRPQVWAMPALVGGMPLIWRIAPALNRWQALYYSWRRYRALCKLDRNRNEAITTSGRDVLVLTLSGRRQHLGESLYEIYSDPVVEELRRLGANCLVWERGQERYPRRQPSAWISGRLAHEMKRFGELPHLMEPPWFSAFSGFAGGLLQRSITWSEVEHWIKRLQLQSLIFQKWMERTSVKILISVCWYDPETMAATLAARRLGILSVDLQHGLQDKDHYAYSGWDKAPPGGYEVVPNVFWTWGQEQVEFLLDGNLAFKAKSRAIAGGNLWYNLWRSGHLSSEDEGFRALGRSISRYRKVILVTFQNSASYYDLVCRAIAGSPADWFWLVRFHPATSEVELGHVKKLLGQIPHARFETDQSTQQPLYALLHMSHVHVTGHSTCALEALGFGIPSVIVSENGMSAFRDYLEKGVMFSADTEGELLERVAQGQDIPAGLCTAAIERFFAPPEQACQNMRALLESAHAGREA